MARIPTGNGNEMAEERVFMEEGNCINKRVEDVLEDEEAYLAEFIGDSDNNPGKTSKNLGEGSRSRK